MSRLPSKPSDWNTAFENRPFKTRTIHDYESPESGSKIGHDQFLLLRVLWNSGTDEALIGSKGDSLLERKHYEKAKERLGEERFWKQYLTSYDTPLGSGAFPQMGTFSLVRHHQVLCHHIEQVKIEDSSPKISSRTRNALLGEQKLEEQKLANLALELNLESPTLRGGSNPIRTGAAPQTPIMKGFLQRRNHEDPEDSEDPESSARSAVIGRYSTPAQGGADSPPVKDEQIVNTALLMFLIAVTMHFDVPADWTLHRQGFKLGKHGTKGYTAKVDGYLTSPSNKQIKAIIEVKALARSKALLAIRRQESAQIAAWIASHPDPKGQAGYR